jgi:hypothetical protein
MRNMNAPGRQREAKLTCAASRWPTIADEELRRIDRLVSAHRAFSPTHARSLAQRRAQVVALRQDALEERGLVDIGGGLFRSVELKLRAGFLEGARMAADGFGDGVPA